MKLPTKEQVRESYVKTGDKPIQGEYENIVDGKTCRCGLTEYVKANNLDSEIEANPLSVIIERLFGTNISCGFIQGFDGLEYYSVYNQNDYNLGRETWEYVKDLAA